MKSMIQKFLARKSVVYGAGAALFVLGTWFLFGNGEKPLETLVVLPGEFVQQVSVSGKVVAANHVDLGFSNSGRGAGGGVGCGG